MSQRVRTTSHLVAGNGHYDINSLDNAKLAGLVSTGISLSIRCLIVHFRWNARCK